MWTHGILIKLIQQVILNSPCRYKIKLGLSFYTLNSNYKIVRLQKMFFAKPTNSFTYVSPTSCYLRKSLNNVPRGIALRLRRICNTDEKFNSRPIEYKNYLIARDCKPSTVNKQFVHVSTSSR